MTKKFEAGQTAPALHLNTIHGHAVDVPTSGKLTHLQFRRFAGCPVCNLHLQSFRQRNEEMETAGVREVVVFHSSASELLPYQGQFPFAVIGDPKKELYRRFGVESSIWAVLNPTTLAASLKANFGKDNPPRWHVPNGGILGLPADFLIGPDGVIISSHYGEHAYDQWSFDEVLDLASSHRN